MIGVCAALAIFAILIVVGVNIPIEISHARAVILLSVSVMSIVMLLMLVTIHYKVTATHLRLVFVCWDALGGRIRIENILNIVYKTDTEGKKPQRKMYISYLWKGPDPVIAQIVIKPKCFDKMRDLLLSKNANIVFYDDDAQNPSTDGQS